MQKNMSNNHTQTQYDCLQCCQTIEKHDLPLHILSHLEGKLSGCESCVLGFDRSESLTQHLLHHVGNILHVVSTEDHPRGTRKRFKRENGAGRDIIFTTRNLERSEGGIHNVSMAEAYKLQLEPKNQRSATRKSEKSQAGKLQLACKNQKSAKRKRTYKCSRCQIEKFASQDDLMKHLETHSPLKTTRKCLHCGKCFSTEAERLLHQKCVCKICGKMFRCDRHLTAHMAYHTGGVQYKCDLCDMVFMESKGLVRHKQVHHRKLHNCKHCGQSFSSHAIKIKHEEQCQMDSVQMSSAKQQIELHACIPCEETFTTSLLLKSHREQCHNKKGTQIFAPGNIYKCTICICQFDTERLLQAHLTTHEIQYHCKCCGRDFHNVWEKENHINSRCKICGTLFVCAIRLAGHEASHSGRIHCITCGTIFDNASDNKAHKNSKCKTCGKAFTCKTLLDIHETSHPVEKQSGSSSEVKALSMGNRHPCNQCKKVFVSAPLLQKHKNQHHKKQVESIHLSGEASTSTLEENRKNDDQKPIVISDKKLKCTICFVQLDTEQTFQLHMQNHVVRYRCRCCLKDFNNAWEKHKHTSSKCRVCGVAFICKIRLNTHEAQHKGEDYHCTHCNVDFHSAEAIHEHRHSECTICGCTFVCDVLRAPHENSHHYKSGPHDCMLCGKMFVELKTLIEHQWFHRNQHKCKDCGKTFPNYQSLTKHSAQDHASPDKASPNKTYECSTCKLSFDTEIELTLHMAAHVRDTSGNFKCGLCNKIFDNAQRTHEHKNAKCKICGKLFGCEDHLTIHIAAHAGEVSHKCDKCGMAFMESHVLEAHIKRYHREPHICKHCGETFKQINVLRKHETQCQVGATEMLADVKKEASASSTSKSTDAVTHDSKTTSNKEIEPWTCGTCSKTFATAKGVAEHLKTHKSDTFHCKKCTTYSCKTEQELKMHMKSHIKSLQKSYHVSRPDRKQVLVDQLKSYQDLHCNNCGKEFQNELQKHNHANSKCRFCGLVFTCRSQMTAHEALHIAEISYKCEDCDEVFTQKLALAEHKHIYHTVRHMCKYCSKKYSSSDELQRHEYWFHEKNNSNSQLDTSETASASQEYTYKCDECAEAFDSRIKLVRHQLMHKLQS